MPRTVAPLTDLQVRNAKPRDKAYKLADGGGLYLEVMPNGAKYWRMKFRQANGKESRLSFGRYPEISLTAARKERGQARAVTAADTDPGQVRRAARHARTQAAQHTVLAVGRQWLARTGAVRAGSTTEKVTGILERNIFPELGAMPIADVKPRDVLQALRKVEARGAHEMAHVAKQLCSRILRYAVACGLAERDVTADLKGALAPVPRRHYAALTDPRDVAGLLRAIRGYHGHVYAKAALYLSALLFVRPGELRAAEWTEFDLDGAEWRIPAAKMKMRQDHIVPLARQAVAALRAVHGITGAGRFVFPSIRTHERCMSENTVCAALRSLGYDRDVMTAHGFRAMARTILDEVLGERVDLIEHQLAHAVKDPNGRAYNRTAHLPARRLMMQRWADYLDHLAEQPAA